MSRKESQSGFGQAWGRQNGWLAIAKLKPLSLFKSLLCKTKKAFDNVEKEKK